MRSLTVPQLMFVVGTRTALGAGVALLASERLSKKQKRAAGIALALLGATTTVPAARLLLKKPSLRDRLTYVAGV
jgi:hypothetical protein